MSSPSTLHMIGVTACPCGPAVYSAASVEARSVWTCRICVEATAESSWSMRCAIEHRALLLGSMIVLTSYQTIAFAVLSMCVRSVLRAISSLNLCWGPGQLDATLPSEEAVLTGQERCNAARKRPTAVKRGVLRARAEASAAAAAAHATTCSAALAAACSAHEDVQRQRQVRGGTHGRVTSFCSSEPPHSVRSLAQTAATDEDGKRPISNPHVFSQVSASGG